MIDSIVQLIQYGIYRQKTALLKSTTTIHTGHNYSTHTYITPHHTQHYILPSNLPLLCVVATKLDLLSPLSVLNTDNPKSASLTSGGLSLLSKIFSGFMSEWMIPI